MKRKTYKEKNSLEIKRKTRTARKTCSIFVAA